MLRLSETRVKVIRPSLDSFKQHIKPMNSLIKDIIRMIKSVHMRRDTRG